MPRIAVLGAGLAGSSVALELVDAGVEVDLFERCARPLDRASLNNEGKVHLGYVYAMDRSLKTAGTMIRGAAQFRRLLARWTGSAFFDANVSAPFIYASPRDSMMSPAELRVHFAGVSQLVHGEASGFANTAVPDAWHEVSRNALTAIFDPALIATAFQTQEIAIDTVALCQKLRAVMSNAPRLNLRTSSQVTGVHEERNGYCVEGMGPDGRFSENYATVVNALWEQRLPVDASLGLDTSRPAVHRYKAGLRTNDAHVSSNLPCVTFLIGSYGDTVAYRDSAYVSWYPSGLLSQEIALSPALFDIPLTVERRAEITSSSLRNLRRLMPGAASCLDETRSGWEIVGGYITAWGRSGIEDKESELHLRYAVGVHSKGNYHSIDTGKLTLAPLFASEACARILRR